MASSISPLYLKSGSHTPLFLHRLGCSQYTLLSRCLVHCFAVSIEKFRHIFLLPNHNKVEQLSNLQTVSLLFLSPDKSILNIGMPLTQEVQRVTSKKPSSCSDSGFRHLNSHALHICSLLHIWPRAPKSLRPWKGCVMVWMCGVSQPLRLPAQHTALHPHQTSHGPAAALRHPALQGQLCPSYFGESGF